MKRIVFTLALALFCAIGWSPGSAEAKDLHAFALPAYTLAQGGVQVTKDELATNPIDYYRPGGYAETLRYMGLTDAEFRRVVTTSTVIDCVGQVTSLRLNSNGQAVSPYTRECYAGEKLLVQRGTGRVLLSLDCLNPTVGMAVTIAKPTKVTPIGGSDHNTPPPCRGEGCNPDTPPPPPHPCDPPPPCANSGHGHNGNGNGGNHGSNGKNRG